jgi:hypothetical protein
MRGVTGRGDARVVTVTAWAHGRPARHVRATALIRLWAMTGHPTAAGRRRVRVGMPRSHLHYTGRSRETADHAKVSFPALRV